MARPVRIEFAGAHYHVTSRGNERKPVYRDDRDRARFLARRAQSLLRQLQRGKSRGARESNLAQTLYALGHVIHLVQDVAQPQHRRLDSRGLPAFLGFITGSHASTQTRRAADGRSPSARCVHDGGSLRARRRCGRILRPVSIPAMGTNMVAARTP